MKYKNESNFFNYKKNKDLLLLMNPGNDLYGFKVVLENRDIYMGDDSEKDDKYGDDLIASFKR